MAHMYVRPPTEFSEEGVWKRCGTSDFYQRTEPRSNLLIDPFKGASVRWDEVPGSDGKAFRLTWREIGFTDNEEEMDKKAPGIQNAIKQIPKDLSFMLAMFWNEVEMRKLDGQTEEAVKKWFHESTSEEGRASILEGYAALLYQKNPDWEDTTKVVLKDELLEGLKELGVDCAEGPKLSGRIRRW
jgi:hypothetical protein